MSAPAQEYRDSLDSHPPSAPTAAPYMVALAGWPEPIFISALPSSSSSSSLQQLKSRSVPASATHSRRHSRAASPVTAVTAVTAAPFPAPAGMLPSPLSAGPTAPLTGHSMATAGTTTPQKRPFDPSIHAEPHVFSPKIAQAAPVPAFLAPAGSIFSLPSFGAASSAASASASSRPAGRDSVPKASPFSASCPYTIGGGPCPFPETHPDHISGEMALGRISAAQTQRHIGIGGRSPPSPKTTIASSPETTVASSTSILSTMSGARIDGAGSDSFYRLPRTHSALDARTRTNSLSFAVPPSPLSPSSPMAMSISALTSGPSRPSGTGRSSISSLLNGGTAGPLPPSYSASSPSSATSGRLRERFMVSSTRTTPRGSPDPRSGFDMDGDNQDELDVRSIRARSPRVEEGEYMRRSLDGMGIGARKVQRRPYEPGERMVRLASAPGAQRVQSPHKARKGSAMGMARAVYPRDPENGLLWSASAALSSDSPSSRHR